MLATELTKSLRHNLLWKWWQRSLTANAVPRDMTWPTRSSTLRCASMTSEATMPRAGESL
ncbi:hypothetical protein LZ30DRAFT_721538, partial [Colletotrichum cereale]